MRRKGALPELLSPAGDFECLVAAVRGGADAVYVGGRSFGARAYAKNFDTDELVRAVRYCHLHGVKLYVTVNTLIYDKEIASVSDFAAELYRIGVDAVIAADLGAISEIKRRVPRLPIHASTQMSVHNTYGADMAVELGCERVVLARELSIENIRSVTERSRAFTEVFLHGALCVCHSGQCLMSSLVGGRSGNRGECAQPCRLPYSGGYPLSLSDLSLADHIKELIDSGVDSLKIEGRMKSPSYVYTVTSIYRRLLDEGRGANKTERTELREVFSRGGFTDGYFTGKIGAPMTGVRSERDKEASKAVENQTFTPDRVKISASVRMRLDEPASMTLTLGDKTVTVTGAIPTGAINAPLTEEDVKSRLSKMGATLLSLSTEDIDLVLDEGINLAPSAINALRRDAAEALESTEREFEDVGTKAYVKSRKNNKAPLKTALFFNTGVYGELKYKNSGALSFFDIVFVPLMDMPLGADFGVYLPPVITDGEIDGVEDALATARERGVEYALIGNIGHIPMIKKHGLTPIGDFRLNVCNSLTKEEYERLGISDIILSPELTLPMARDIGGGEIVLGRIPLMLTERCFVKENFGCDKCMRAALTDRTGAKFPIIREYNHRNIILNSSITYMGDKKSELSSMGITHEHFIFTTEGSSEAANLISSYKKSGSLGYAVRRIGKRRENDKK